LTPEERLEFYEGVDGLLQDPTPDGRSKVELSFPYRPGTLGYSYHRLFLTYTFLNPVTISVIWASRIIDPPT